MTTATLTISALEVELNQVDAAIEALLLRKKELEDAIEAQAIEIEKRRMEGVELAKKEAAVATKTQEPKAVKGASRVKRSKKVDAMVEAVKGKRDVDAGTAAKIDATKQAASEFKPAKVQQEKRTTKKAAAEKATKAPKKDYNGMTYAQLRSEVSQRKAQLNKADQKRMSDAGCKNNTWDGAITSIEWLNRYFPIAK